MNRYADCTYCGGEVVEQRIDYDYRRQKRLMVVSNVPAGVCRQCGEKYFKPDILTRHLRMSRKAAANLDHSRRVALAILATRSTNNLVDVSRISKLGSIAKTLRDNPASSFVVQVAPQACAVLPRFP